MSLQSLTSILISRFLLRLQAANRVVDHASSGADVHSIVFERVIGSIGAPISPEDFLSGEREMELWDNEDTTDPVPKESGVEERNVEEGNLEREEVV